MKPEQAKRGPGRPPSGITVKCVSITLPLDTFAKLDRMRGTEKRSHFIARLIDRKVG